ncbi:MAG: hypothetical protein ACKPKO_49140, partial [Candidatus Fonsibacter sp.]
MRHDIPIAQGAKEDILEGYVKLLDEAAPDVEAKSGTQGIFLSIIMKGSADKPQVDWIGPLQGESDIQYFTRVAAEARS